MVFSIYDSTEDAVKKMIAANERTLNLGGGDGIVDAAYDGLKVDQCDAEIEDSCEA